MAKNINHTHFNCFFFLPQLIQAKIKFADKDSSVSQRITVYTLFNTPTEQRKIQNPTRYKQRALKPVETTSSLKSA